MARTVPIITLFRDGRMVEERPLGGRRLDTGRDWRCDLADPQAEFGRRRLVTRTLSGYKLHLPRGAEGTVERSGSVMNLKDMKVWGLVRESSRGLTLTLDRDMAGEFRIGTAIYRLRFDAPTAVVREAGTAPIGSVPVSCKMAPPDRTDLVFSGILLLVAAVWLMIIQGLSQVEIPDITTIQQLPRRISRLILEPVAPPVTAPGVREAAPGVEETPARETAEDVGETLPEPTAETTPPPPDESAPGPSRETVRKRVSTVGVLGVLTGKGTAGRAAGRKGISALQLDDDLAQSLDDVLSAVGEITTAAEGGTSVGMGPGGEGSGLLGIEGQLGGSGVDSPVQVSSLGDLPGQPGGEGDVEEEIVRPENREERSTRAIARVVAAHTGAIRYAYNRELRKNPALRGKVVLTFTITAAGEVVECRVEESAMDWPPLEEALVRMVYKWRFPEIPEGDVTVSYPLIFFPSM